MKISIKNANSKRVRDLAGGTIYRRGNDVYMKTGKSPQPSYSEYRAHPTASIALTSNGRRGSSGHVIKQFDTVYWNEEARDTEICYDEIIGKMEIDL